MANELAPCFLSRPSDPRRMVDVNMFKCITHEVWSGNLEVELKSFLAAVASAGPAGVVALDTEFPGFLKSASQYASSEVQYAAARANVQLLSPIQLGFAVSNSEKKEVLGVWNFNLSFDASKDLHLESAVSFLREVAGLDLERHASAEGIALESLGERLGQGLKEQLRAQGSSGQGQAFGPLWVTFSGLHDLAYLLKVLHTTSRGPGPKMPSGPGAGAGQSLPASRTSFEAALDAFCPHRCELKELLPPFGSLESWVQEFQLPRIGRAHTAGSDAFATLLVFLRIISSCSSSGGGCGGQMAAVEAVDAQSTEEEEEKEKAVRFIPSSASPWSAAQGNDMLVTCA